MASYHLLLILLPLLKLGQPVILMKKRNYRAINASHTKLSFKMTSRGSFGLASSGDQALMRNGYCRVHHPTCPKSQCGEVKFRRSFRETHIQISARLSPCIKHDGVRIEVQTLSDSSSHESWLEGDWNGKQVDGWFWTLDLPKLTNANCTNQLRHSFRDVDNSTSGNSANGTSANSNSANGTNPILIASIASSVTLVLTLALVFALLFVRRRYRRTSLEKVDSNYDYGVYYG